MTDDTFDTLGVLPILARLAKGRRASLESAPEPAPPPLPIVVSTPDPTGGMTPLVLVGTSVVTLGIGIWVGSQVGRRMR